MAWIDMRNEMRILINGDRTSVAQGRWCIMRIFRRNQLTPNWVPDVDEAINGPKYYYDDHLVRTISYPAGKFSKTDRTVGGLDAIAGSYDEKDTYIFAIEYNAAFARIPDENDLIFQIDKFESVLPPIPPFRATDRFKIIHAFPDYGDNGRIEMMYCIGVRSHGES